MVRKAANFLGLEGPMPISSVYVTQEVCFEVPEFRKPLNEFPDAIGWPARSFVPVRLLV